MKRIFQLVSFCFTMNYVHSACPPEYHCALSPWFPWTTCPPCGQRMRTRIKGMCCFSSETPDQCVANCNITYSQRKQEETCPIPTKCLTKAGKILCADCLILCYL